MNRLTKTLALAAAVLAGAFGATAAQASAANFQVDFAVKNNDASYSMIRITSPLPNGVSGLIDPASAIATGASDPSSGNATYSLGLPALNGFSQTTLVYGKAADSTQQCTFTMKVSHDLNTQPYLLHFTTSDSTRCPVPGDARSSDGQFTAQTYLLNWSS
ncbi:MAG TPA: hypothetical protein VE826_14725 [Dongiaceae bacterium]|nr:hypothetical protein [Dongiaceae bacterium]